MKVRLTLGFALLIVSAACTDSLTTPPSFVKLDLAPELPLTPAYAIALGPTAQEVDNLGQSGIPILQNADEESSLEQAVEQTATSLALPSATLEPASSPTVAPSPSPGPSSATPMATQPVPSSTPLPTKTVSPPTSVPTSTPLPPTETSVAPTNTPKPAATSTFTPNPASAPYPYSTTIIGITWAPASSIIRQATGSDNWPLTWADDGSLYTAYGDGWGFDPKVPNKLSLGFARVDGSATNFSGVNIYPSDGQQTGGGSSGKKASGMLMVDGVLYMWVRNANGAGKQCQLAWSSDKALTWSWADWTFSELGYCAFLNFGKNYSGARDDYVYMYSPNTSSAYNETDSAVLTRVPRGKITDRSAYEFVKSVSGSGNPTWTSNISQRGTVFAFPGGVNRLDVTYNAGIGRYLMTMRSRAKSGGLNQFSIYDAPQPWGPWSTVFYTENWDTDPGEVQHIPSKWISGDGKTIYLIFAGNDSFSVRKATLTVSS